MKKVLATIMVLSYLLVSTGFIVCAHYCMGEFASVQLGENDDDSCGKCGMEKDGGCCRDEVTMVKISSDHLASSSASLNAPWVAIVPERLLTLIEQPTRSEKLHEIPVAHAPPRSDQDRYLQLCVFRI